MVRDTYVFLGFLLLFAVVNIGLVVSGVLSADWTGLGVITGAGMTLALYSFLYKDNPLFKFAEHVFVGVASAYIFGQYWYPTIYGSNSGYSCQRRPMLFQKYSPSYWLMIPLW